MDIMDKLMQNEALMEGIGQAKTPAELAALLEAHDVALEGGISAEQLFAQLKAEPGDELDEGALEGVSGGSILGAVYAIAKAYAKYKSKQKGRSSSGGGGGGAFGGGGGGFR